jgi:hypothetical protein
MQVDLPIKQSKSGQTKLLVTFPYSLRVGLNQVSAKLGLSQQSLIRSAVAQLLYENDIPEKPKARTIEKPKAKRTSAKRTRKGGTNV